MQSTQVVTISVSPTDRLPADLLVYVGDYSMKVNASFDVEQARTAALAAFKEMIELPTPSLFRIVASIGASSAESS